MEGERAKQSKEQKDSERAANTASKKRERVEQANLNKDQDVIRLEQLAAAILDQIDIDPDDLEFLRTSQNFTRHPNLGLAYFHACSGHPDAFVFNDEKLNGPEGKAVRERMQRVIGKAVGQAEAIRCSRSAKAHDPSQQEIVACASCCEYLWGEEYDPKKNRRPIEKVHANTKLTTEQIDELRRDIDDVNIEKHVQVLRVNDQDWYFLNPDLVPDTTSIVLCDTCVKNPKTHEFSIASGHDYGRRGDLPELNDTGIICVSPVRVFNIEISLRANHASKHAICYPSDGPEEFSKVMPDMNKPTPTHVIYSGTPDQWHKEKHKFKETWRLEADEIFAWLSVKKQIDHRFRDIDVTDTPAKREALQQMNDLLESSVQITNDKTTGAANDYINATVAANSSNYEDDSGGGEEGEIVQSKSVVLPQASNYESGIRTSIEAMLDVIAPATADDDDDNLGESTDDNAHDTAAAATAGSQQRAPKTIAKAIEISTKEGPICEWDENDRLLAGAFATLFMRGMGLKSGSMSTKMALHLFKYYDGRFASSIMFVATLFNQMARHQCVRAGSKVAMSHIKALEMLGDLANSAALRRKLEWARDNASTPAAKRINAQILRIISMVGATVRFSPFERAATRSKLPAARIRYGISAHFVTGAPPEHDSLALVRTALMQHWNDPKSALGKAGVTWEDIPEKYRASSFERLQLARERPDLRARVFEQALKTFLIDIVRCPESKHTRLSRDYLMRERGAYAETAAISATLEAQQEGRMHWHMLLYSSVLTPDLLTRLGKSYHVLCHYTRKRQTGKTKIF
jgi:hypothetical protein